MPDLSDQAVRDIEMLLDQRVTLSFERDIRPLFRDVPDVACMAARNLDLTSFDQVSRLRAVGGALDIFRRVEDGNMPKGGPQWTDPMVITFGLWIKQGMKP
jgi:hypothetical protein